MNNCSHFSIEVGELFVDGYGWHDLVCESSDGASHSRVSNNRSFDLMLPIFVLPILGFLIFVRPIIGLPICVLPIFLPPILGFPILSLPTFVP